MLCIERLKNGFKISTSIKLKNLYSKFILNRFTSVIDFDVSPISVLDWEKLNLVVKGKSKIERTPTEKELKSLLLCLFAISSLT